MEVADGKLTPLTHEPGLHQEAVASPDGRLIACTSCNYAEQFDQPKLHVTNADDSAVRRLTQQ